ncbi:hypothetical protein YK48G_06310 [Lentilactobacillus fungorum]|uniref:ABC transporter permease n=1 Tax=Lentilactobacillus fungorum TaxID=2201250 RepID=A0ABQ3VXQ1_9LACO|nr:ABC transporter permease [Lentilactobacillus fungorum]GHP13206.1 hypothetical protein YK48G_06310 [Lentilactobacillus fungorum]
MTSFSSITKALSRPKLSIINRIVIVDALAIIITILFQVYKGTLSGMDPVAITLTYSIFAYLVAFVLLARNVEHTYTSSSYRLIPASDTKLYSASLLSALVAMVYMGLAQVGLALITSALDFPEIAGAARQMFSDIYQSSDKTSFGLNIFVIITGSILLLIALALFCWATISLIHLIGNALTNFLPDSRQKFFRFVLYVVVIVVFLYVFTYVVGMVNGILHNFKGVLDYSSNAYLQIYFGSIYLFAFALVESMGNVYLLKNWVETEN